MPAYDYAAVADIYDDFCVFDADIEFFRNQAAAASGAVLELMAGTGRISIMLLENGANLTAVDRSPAMLKMLAHKISTAPRAHLVCADVCELPLANRYDRIFLPFQGFTELVGDEAQRHCLAEATRLLAPGGRFVCTSHNPSARGQTIDGTLRELGRFQNAEGNTLVLLLKTVRSTRPGVVEGTQTIEIFDRGDQLIDTRVIDLEFSLVPPADIVEMARSSGLEPVELFGDYKRSAFEEESSPCFVAVFERRHE
jgi:SAM-dependent methyltransferase